MARPARVIAHGTDPAPEDGGRRRVRAAGGRRAASKIPTPAAIKITSLAHPSSPSRASRRPRPRRRVRVARARAGTRSVRERHRPLPTPRHAESARPRDGARGGAHHRGGDRRLEAPGMFTRIGARHASGGSRGGAITSGLVRRLAEALAESFDETAVGFPRRPRRRRRARRSRRRWTSPPPGSPHAAEALLRRRRALVPHLVAGLGLVGDPAAAETPPAATVFRRRRPRAPPRRRRARRARTGGKRWNTSLGSGSGSVFPVPRFRFRRFSPPKRRRRTIRPTPPRRRMTAGKGRRMFAVRPVVFRERQDARDARGRPRVQAASGAVGAHLSSRALRSTEGTGGARPGHSSRDFVSSRRSSTRARPTRARTPSGGAGGRRRRRSGA